MHKARQPSTEKHGKSRYKYPMTNSLKLTEFEIGGFAANNAMPGEEALVITRAMLTSDEREFHLLMQGITNLLSARLHAAGHTVLFSGIHAMLLVVHADTTADLYLNDFPVVAQIRAKRDMAAGAIVMQGAIADIDRLSFPGIAFAASDKVLVCLKVGWKFALYLDLADQRSLDTDQMSQALGHLFRILTFQEIYDVLADPVTYSALRDAGWFPFIEITGGEVEALIRAHKSNFNVEGETQALIDKFTPDRIDAMFTRWSARSSLNSRHKILRAALDAYKRGDAIASTKILLTEIEGILREAHITELGETAGIKALLEYASTQGIKKTGSESSLYFPHQFLEYLTTVVFGQFNPMTGTGATTSRQSRSVTARPKKMTTRSGARYRRY